jgi:5-methylcytosine-specific restriction endonuclease McrBC regulatory subunit McrC
MMRAPPLKKPQRMLKMQPGKSKMLADNMKVISHRDLKEEDENILNTLKEFIKKKRETNESAEKWLGLEFSPDTDEIRPSHYLGQIWLEPKRLSLRVDSTAGMKDQPDVFAMLRHCLEEQAVARRLCDKSLFLDLDQPPLETKDQKEVNLLVIVRFLRDLYDLCRRFLRRGFIRVEDNLAARCKGRLLINDNLRHNLARVRADRLYCQFQVHSLDSPLNQILRAALEQSLRYLRRLGFENKICLWHWGNFALATLAGVKLRRIYLSEFSGLHLTGLLRPYRQPKNSAKIIIRLLGSDPTSELSEQAALPPYSINMFELFERYCEVWLRRKLKKLWAGYDDQNLGEVIKIRPDFIGPAITEEGKIIDDAFGIYDAKYKYNWVARAKDSEDEKNSCRGDVYQLLAYSRHQLKSKKGAGPDISRYKQGIYGLYILVPEFSSSSEVSSSSILKNPKNFCKDDFVKDIVDGNGQTQPLHFFTIDVPVPKRSSSLA